MATNQQPISPRIKVKRLGRRGSYDRGTINAILDSGLVCHVGFVFDNYPVVLPTLYWRDGDRVLWHGSTASRMLRAVEGNDVCVSVTLFDGLVLARSAFNHSANYRSAVLFGRAAAIDDPEEKLFLMRKMTESIVPGRWDRLRPMTPKELKVTRILSIGIDEASAKVRAGGPNDIDDAGWPVWAGVLPYSLQAAPPQPDGEHADELTPFAARPR